MAWSSLSSNQMVTEGDKFKWCHIKYSTRVCILINGTQVGLYFQIK